MSDVAKEEIAAMLDRCGTKLVERLVTDPVFDAVRQHMPRGTKHTLVCPDFPVNSLPPILERTDTHSPTLTHIHPHEQLFERGVEVCTLQRFWSLMPQRERERTAQCFGVTATDFPERAQRLGVDDFVSAADTGLLADFTALLNLTQAKGADRDEVRKLVCDELMLSGVLHVLTHVAPALMHDVARAHGIAFAATDSAATVADWIMCVAFKLDPVPGGRLPDLVAASGEPGGDSSHAAGRRAHQRSSGRTARGTAAAAAKEEEAGGDGAEDAAESEPAEKRQKTAAGAARKSSSSSSSSSSTRQKEEEDTAAEPEAEQDQEQEQEKNEEGEKKEDTKPAEQGYYTEDGKWVHPPFELIMARRFDAQGLYNNFNLPDLVEFCRMHGLPLSSAKKKNALIRVILQYVETGVVPQAGKRKSGGARRASAGDAGKKAGDAAEEEDAAEHSAASPSPSPS